MGVRHVGDGVGVHGFVRRDSGQHDLTLGIRPLDHHVDRSSGDDPDSVAAKARDRSRRATCHTSVDRVVVLA